MVSDDETVRKENDKADKMRSLALCVYLGTYFRKGQGQNRDSDDLFMQATEQEREYIAEMWEEKEQDLNREIMGYEETSEVFDSFSDYKKVCQQSGESNSEKL